MDRSPSAAAAPRRRHTLVVSDLHLSQAHPPDPSDPEWMRYRTREFHPDEDFAGLVDHVLATRGADPIELVFNGDVFDFDAPWVKEGHSSSDEFALDDAGCAQHMRRILADHEPLLRAVARALAAGHRALFLSGNHDIELYWPGVRAALRETLVRLAREERPEALVDEREQIRFRAWFHVSEDRLYFEHGSQYDFLNNVRHAMLPVTRGKDLIHPVMGKLAFKRTGARMGYMNPYFEDTFYMGFADHLRHFLTRYAFSAKRHIGRVWAHGAFSTIFEIWRERHGDHEYEEARALAHAETGASFAAIDATHTLAEPSAELTMMPIIRELWADRVSLGAVVLLVVAFTALLAGPLPGLATLGVCVLLFLLYERLVPKPELRAYDANPPRVEQLFAIHGVRAVCLGHTHRPYAKWQEGRVLANSGTWCPAFQDLECTKPVLPERPCILLTTDGEALSGGLHWWKDGVLRADPAHSRADETGRDAA
jgi:UDP-2,3-diacylglucosamine pyrophosphatase LpxH